MNIANNKALELFLIVVVCIAPGWAQKSDKNTALTKQMAAASTPAPITSSGSSEMISKDPNEFVIGSEDVLAINVWKEPEVSHAVAVRSDGKISLPLLGDIQAAGKTPKQLQVEIAQGLASYISDPEVAVIVQTINSKKYSILGRVPRAGSFSLAAPMTILDAIAAAGGFQDFAKRKKVYILRTGPDGREQRIPFNYTQVIKGDHPEQNIKLQTRDIIIVP
ncbi:MAG TPA: polysaccharide biosynthesis/export family protein [Terriglobales bacterium]|nr:polysaccharide biosynthesis/export family protein [Terriglobales bacterium]